MNKILNSHSLFLGSIHGVEVAGEAEFTVPAEGGSFQWEGYGLRLHVPKDSLPAGTAECQDQHQSESLWAVSAS